MSPPPRSARSPSSSPGGHAPAGSPGDRRRFDPREPRRDRPARDGAPTVVARHAGRDPGYGPATGCSGGARPTGRTSAPLKAINRGNVKTLAPAWRAPLPSGPSMPTPLVHDGVMFLQTDAGHWCWRWTRAGHGRGPVAARLCRVQPIPSSQKMGLALSGGRAVRAHLRPACDRARRADRPAGPGTTRSPSVRPATDRKLVPAAQRAADRRRQGDPGRHRQRRAGRRLHRGARTSPRAARLLALSTPSARPGEPGGDSWNGLPLAKRSGASVWDQGSYDPALNLVYFGVGQTYDTGPLLKPSGVPGTTQDSLYTDSTIALDPDTGPAWSGTTSTSATTSGTSTGFSSASWRRSRSPAATAGW